MRKFIIPLSAALLVTASQASFGDQIYKCKNAEGRLLYQKTPCVATAETLSSWTQTYKAPLSPSADAKSGSAPLLVKQHGSGHYFVDGAINGKALVFVIDTGASVVSLPSNEASAAGIACRKTALMETANGLTEACTAVIPELRFGHFLIKNAESMIVPNLGQPLLGMNILRHFKIAQDNGEMRISVP
ncbi:retropepsin-like aspartic protease family protein [Methylomicrobium sp. RS1]|jgi:aspartyl protease family protein|uniref:retropepsin-like aspartic protease family protein n=1 Tax=Candidatus Methylomicrobium oryzae TaxID=2802053 RepID=UPI001924284E|nr:TIGR02281 family clan AA aspartic protease [Methylomicrobium sp. RS1]MBL1263043.1 retroviral-like aspartic protease family protein [Methylomicrobium sp. RS1]